MIINHIKSLRKLKGIIQNTVLRKGLVLGLVCLFIWTNIVPNINGNSDEKTSRKNNNFSDYENEEKCYGFAIPLILGENIPYTSIQQSIVNAINDFLRLNISVYWGSTNFTALAKKVGNNVSETHSFEQGTFLILFTGNFSTDILITSIMYNYGYHSEIENYFPVEYYHLMEPISIAVYHLNNPRILYYLGDEIVWDWLIFHFDTVQNAGFLNIDFLLAGERYNERDY